MWPLSGTSMKSGSLSLRIQPAATIFHQYADVDAVRVPINEPHGLPHLLEETWSRYQLPLVIWRPFRPTGKNSCGGLKHVYSGCRCRGRMASMCVPLPCGRCSVRLAGINCPTGETHDYETGALISVQVISGLQHWQQWPGGFVVQEGMTIICLPVAAGGRCPRAFMNKTVKPLPFSSDTVQPVLITGKTGDAGPGSFALCIERNLHHVLTGREEIDICDEQQVADAIKRYKPWAVINTAGYVHVDHAERQRSAVTGENYMAASNLAAVCSRHGIKLLSFSSDLVFGGGQQHPYVERIVPAL